MINAAPVAETGMSYMSNNNIVLVYAHETTQKSRLRDRGLSDEQISALGRGPAARSAGLPTIEDAVKSGAWLCGPPELVTERLMELQHKYPGLEQVNVGATAMSTQESVILEQLELFGKEVMPAFKKQVVKS